MMNTELSMTLLDFFKQSRRPIYYKSKLNQLSNNEVLSFGGIRRSIGRKRFAYGQAYIQKLTKNQFSFVGLWTLPSKPERHDYWVQGSFTLSKGVMRFENGITSDHLRAFFKVCRYLGVHKRKSLAQYQQAHIEYSNAVSQRNEAMRNYEEEFNCYPESETVDFLFGVRPFRDDFNCWFLAHGYEPLFDGEVLRGGYSSLSSDLDFDTRDRIMTTPWLALSQKQLLREKK